MAEPFRNEREEMMWVLYCHAVRSSSASRQQPADVAQQADEFLLEFRKRERPERRWPSDPDPDPESPIGQVTPSGQS